MNLLYTLPPQEQAVLQRQLAQEPIRYCVPFDLHRDGSPCTGGWVVVTRHTLYVLEDGAIRETVSLDEAEEILCSPQIDCGLLIAKWQGEEHLLCRFSMRHMVRHSYVARGADAFCRGMDREVLSREREKSCPICGRALRGTNHCPRCEGGRLRSFRRFLNLCGAYIGPLLCLLVFMLVISAIAIVQQEVQKNFVDDVLIPVKGSSREVLQFFAIMFGFLIVTLGLSMARNIWSNMLGSRISRDLRARVFQKINTLSLSFLDSRQAGELMNRVVEDSNAVRRFMEEVFAGMFTHIFTILGAMIAMVIINWRLALLAIAFMPAAAILVRVFHKKERRMFRQQWRFNDRVNNRLQDVISGIRVVKSFGQEKKEADRFQAETERLMQLQRRNELFWATLYPFVTFLLTVGTFFVIYFGGMGVLEGRMTAGELTQFVAYAGMLYGPLGYLTRLPRMLMMLTTSLERIYDILDEETDVPQAPEPQEHDIEGWVSFRDVTFGYHSYLPVLSHLNLEVKPGEMIGLVGPSGAGKSTLINLLMRLYDVDDGSILLDGIDLRQYAQDSLHRQIGVVLQETFLFSGSIFDNIRYAKPDATPLEVIQAAKMANAHEFITRFPDGYDTYVGEHGYTLSGGERQRIAIARALLHDPRLLILDEATSSLDTETEYQIQEALGRLTKNRTTFAIAHRLSTLREADRLVVIDDHQVAEVGTHNELMRRKGIYYGLVMAQLEMHKVRQ